MSVQHDIAIRIAPERPADAAAAAGLVERVFGPGRFAKVSERLREGNRFVPELSFVAYEGERLIGSVRLWPVRIGGRPALLLGPLAVDPAGQGRGVGASLVEHACDAAARAGHEVIVLVGDFAFFERIGFERPAPDVTVTLPGPADGRRILFKALKPGALDGLQGPVTLP